MRNGDVTSFKIILESKMQNRQACGGGTISGLRRMLGGLPRLRDDSLDDGEN